VLDGGQQCFVYFGIFLAFLAGAILPTLALIFGQITRAYNP
jgi:hypothetical protein